MEKDSATFFFFEAIFIPPVALNYLTLSGSTLLKWDVRFIIMVTFGNCNFENKQQLHKKYHEVKSTPL